MKWICILRKPRWINLLFLGRFFRFTNRKSNISGWNIFFSKPLTYLRAKLVFNRKDLFLYPPNEPTWNRSLSSELLAFVTFKVEETSRNSSVRFFKLQNEYRTCVYPVINRGHLMAFANSKTTMNRGPQTPNLKTVLSSFFLKRFDWFVKYRTASFYFDSANIS